MKKWSDFLIGIWIIGGFSVAMIFAVAGLKKEAAKPQFKIVQLSDGCEYLQTRNQNLVHKGSCQFCYTRLRELLKPETSQEK